MNVGVNRRLLQPHRQPCNYATDQRQIAHAPSKSRTRAPHSTSVDGCTRCTGRRTARRSSREVVMFRVRRTARSTVTAVRLTDGIAVRTRRHALVTGSGALKVGDRLCVLRSIGRFVVRADALERERILSRRISWVR